MASGRASRDHFLTFVGSAWMLFPAGRCHGGCALDALSVSRPSFVPARVGATPPNYLRDSARLSMEIGTVGNATIELEELPTIALTPDGRIRRPLYLIDSRLKWGTNVSSVLFYGILLNPVKHFR
jgi:hypothetical protein